MIDLTLPIKTVSEANASEHWSKRHRRRKAQHNAIWAYMRHHQFPIPCKITLTRISPRKLDDDNLTMAFKSIRDALASLIIPGLTSGMADSDNRLQWAYMQESGKPQQIRIQIEATCPIAITAPSSSKTQTPDGSSSKKTNTISLASLASIKPTRKKRAPSAVARSIPTRTIT